MRSLKEEAWFIVSVVAITLFLLFGVGCSGSAVYDSDRQLQEQNSEAAASVVQNGSVVMKNLDDLAAGAFATPPTIGSVDALAKIAAARAALQLQQQAAADIKANSDQELKNWGGPKVSKPYTPANSGQSRQQSDQEHSNPWYVQLGKALLVAVTTAGSIFLAAQGLPGVSNLFAKPALKALGVGFQAVANIQQKADANPNDTIHLSDVEAEISALAQNPSVTPYLNGLLKTLHLNSLLPQTPPPAAPPVPAPAPVVDAPPPPTVTKA